MPLPILIAGAAAAALFGAKKGIDAHSTNKDAAAIGEKAEGVFESAKRRLEEVKSNTTATMSALGRIRLEAWDRDMNDFITVFELIKDVQLTGTIAKDDFAKGLVDQTELRSLRDLSMKASEIVGGGLGALGSGALAGVAAYGGAMTFGAASTGTAIASLSGVAATNATLAWLGGGSLAAGGMGMAGGMMVLGGLVAGPAILVGGWMLSAKAKANLAKAEASLAEANKLASEMKTAGVALHGIASLATQYIQALNNFRAIFGNAIRSLKLLIRESGTSFPSYSQHQKETVWLTAECAGVMKQLLETPLLNKDGSISTSATDPLALPDKIAATISLQAASAAAHG
jgi:hypothetical protein